MTKYQLTPSSSAKHPAFGTGGAALPLKKEGTTTMRLAVRIHDRGLIEHLEMLDTEHGRGARSRFINEAALAYLGRRVATVEEKADLKIMVRQLIGVATNVHQLSKNANMQKEQFAPSIG